MGDQLNRYDDMYTRTQILYGRDLKLDDNSLHWILNHVDSFDRHVRLNETIREVDFCGYSGDGRDDEVWNKIGQAIGNLQALERLCIYSDYDEEAVVVPIPDCEVLARILSHVRQKIKVRINGIRRWDAEKSKALARAIHGHPTITSFEHGDDFPYEVLDSLYSAVATLPALESICLLRPQRYPPMLQDDAALARTKSLTESLTELLRVPSLRSACLILSISHPF
jgi:hypothetical protein